MAVTVSLSDEVLSDQGGDLARKVLEQVAVEGFKSGHLTTSQVRRLLGFETRMQVHEFLTDHGLHWVDYSVEDADRERELLRRVLSR